MRYLDLIDTPPRHRVTNFVRPSRTVGRCHIPTLLPEESIYILDGTSMLFRAFYGRGAGGYLASNGVTEVGAVLAMGIEFAQFINEVKPRYVAMAFDVKRETTFRRELYPEYKAHRKPVPVDLNHQIPLAKALSEALGCRTFSMEGYEADDVMATLARWGRSAGLGVVVCSSDKDMCQLVRDRVHVMQPRSDGYTVLGDEEVMSKFGVKPSALPDLFGLVGDVADNIPGVKGIGPKGGSRLLEKFGTLEGIFAGLEGVGSMQVRGSKSLQALLSQPGVEEEAMLYREIATLDDEVPLEGYDALTSSTFLYKGAAPEAEGVMSALGFHAPLRMIQEGSTRPAAPSSMKTCIGLTALLAAFPPCLGVIDGSKEHQPTHPLTSGSVCRVRDSLDFLSPSERAKVTLHKRVGAAKEEFQVGPTCHITNGDEQSVPDFAGQFHKSLPHDYNGVVDAAAYEKLLDCAFSADINVCDKVPSGARMDGAKMINPLGGTAHQIDGADTDNVFITTPDGVLSERLAAQMAEVYWMALTRDIPFNDFATDPVIAAAAENLENLPEFKGLNIPKGKNGKIDPMQELFRTDWPGVTNGPLVSQLLLSDFVIDTIRVTPKQTTLVPGMDYMTSVQDWLDVQNGASKVETIFVDDNDARFIRNGRDLAAIAFGDLLYTEAFRAALIMFRQGILSSGEGPYSASERQVGFATFGEPHILTSMAASSSSTRNAWYAKWQVHRVLRPEAYGGLVHNTLTPGRPNTPLPDSLLKNTELLNRVKKHNAGCNSKQDSSYLLPMAVAEGSPVHPAYPSGHAINLGAYITTLKAFLGFELGQRCYKEQLVMSNSEGTERVEYHPVKEDVCIDEHGKAAKGLTYEGELNKVASNVIIGRSHIGVHYRMDGVYGALMGETSAVRRLQEELPNLSEARESKIGDKNTIPPASYKFRLYSGKVLELFAGDLFKLDGKICKGAFTGDDFCEEVQEREIDLAHLSKKGGDFAFHTEL
eukprot:g13503.t1